MSSLSVTIGTETRVFDSKPALMLWVKEFDHAVTEGNLAQARRRCKLGWALTQAKGALGYGHFSHVYNDAGVSNRRGQQVVRLFKECGDPATGDLNEEMWREAMTETVRLHNANQRRTRLDANGDPTVHATEQTLGLRPTERGPTCAQVCATGENGSKGEPRFAFDRDSVVEVSNPIADLQRQIEREADGPAGCVGSEQLDLDFRLVETEQALAAEIQRAEAMLANGDLAAADAERLQHGLDALLSDVRAVTGAA